MAKQYTGFCTECKSPQNDKYMEATGFQNPPCKVCGGLVKEIGYETQDDLKKTFKSWDAKRGLN